MACSGDMPSLKEEEIQKLNSELNQWIIVKNQDGIKTLTKYLKFKNFEQSLDFINKLSAIAEQEGHHPDLSFGWGYANVTIFTHAVKGLTESDFILAAKIDQISV
ncbi:MAG: pterin-4-alpha-carbinolamine dehydratase [alpha proteobacterium QL1]|nr:MAG: pterin-4-alpha-carbinolamine dehydratase [alpha proteobacterium QL1]